MNYTDLQLKLTLAKLLPSHIAILENHTLIWIHGDYLDVTDTIRDTELLHICWLIEMSLTDYEYNLHCNYRCQEKENNHEMRSHQSATWQIRTISLAKIKGISII